MAFNNNFGNPYGVGNAYYTNNNQFQPQVQQQVQPQVQNQNANNGLIWVQGEAGRKSYHVAPGQTVTLWDTENPVIYLKSADMSGMPSTKILDYTVREDTTQQKAPIAQNTDFATKEDIKALEGKINSVITQLEGLNKKGNKKGSKKDE